MQIKTANLSIDRDMKFKFALRIALLFTLTASSFVLRVKEVRAQPQVQAAAEFPSYAQLRAQAEQACVKGDGVACVRLTDLLTPYKQDFYSFIDETKAKDLIGVMKSFCTTKNLDACYAYGRFGYIVRTYHARLKFTTYFKQYQDQETQYFLGGLEKLCVNGHARACRTYALSSSGDPLFGFDSWHPLNHRENGIFTLNKLVKEVPSARRHKSYYY
jgi:hypothetical protein